MRKLQKNQVARQEHRYRGPEDAKYAKRNIIFKMAGHVTRLHDGWPRKKVVEKQ